MTKFWELFERSVILQAALTLLFASVICYLVIVGQTVPEIVAYALSTIIGYYFGSKTVTEASHQAQKLRERDKEV
uniref:Uncharacterized protein n=1 Tax=viral metagenome TaxID=1070528 RepID=A0A6M3LQH5_9ZZZZ